MIKFNRNIRSNQKEVMDDFDFRGREMTNLLHDLKIVNKWLGGNRVIIDGLRKLLKDQPKSIEVVVLDIGCGDGELLRKCSNFARQNGYKIKCIGIDYNENILEQAIIRSQDYPSLEFRKVDVLDENLIPNCDIALFTLFLHHFSNEQINRILISVLSKSNKGLIISDLQRSKMAFVLFKFISPFLLKTKMARRDGLISIARGFRKKELENFSNKIPNQRSTIRLKWAYRYQWIVKKKT